MFVAYPEESVPVFTHAILMITIAVLVIFVTACFYHRNANKELSLSTNVDLSFLLKDVLPISGIIIAVVTPFLQLVAYPLVDFDFPEPARIKSSNYYYSIMTIDNLGIAAAKNVTVSINSPSSLDFTKPTSVPFLPYDTKSFSSTELKMLGKAIFILDSLPPHSRTKINITVLATDDTIQGIIPYVRTTNAVGYHHTLYVTIAYLLFSLLIIFIPLRVFKWIKTGQGKFIILMAVAVFFIAILLMATPTNCCY